MAAVEITLSGVLYDKLSRTTRPVVLIGEASLTGVGIGGGPVIPPEGGGGDGQPPGIWGGGNVPMPTPPIANVPGAPGFPPPHPAHPIVLPPDQVPPDMRPDTPPPPGSPTTPVPPPEGSGGWPVQPITPPPYLVVTYPGIGPVYVAPPAGTEATPSQR